MGEQGAPGRENPVGVVRLPFRSLLQVVEGVVWNGEVAASRHFKRCPHVRLGKLAEEVCGRALKHFHPFRGAWKCGAALRGGGERGWRRELRLLFLRQRLTRPVV